MDYKTSGVNIDAGNQAVDKIKPLIAKTTTPFVQSGLGHFAAMTAIPPGYTEPVLVSCTDGVGTKLRIAIDENQLDTIGIDLVAMCINDLICCGATPLCFLDYIACHRLDPTQIEIIVSGIAEGCCQSGCALVGGEMAEMNDLYRPGDYDLAGFACGVVEKSKIIDGSKIAVGDTIYGIPSSGIHSNGFTLVRHILTPDVRKRQNIQPTDLLIPTRIYVEDIRNLLPLSSGIAHITGGGLAENISRILPKTVSATIDKTTIPVPPIFRILQKEGNVSDAEMWRVFNMGIGMVIISPDPTLGQADLVPIGKIIAGDQSVFL